jgi:hypothetical protein
MSLEDKNNEKFLIKKGVKPAAARLAINMPEFKRWLDDRQKAVDIAMRMNNLGMVAGTVINSNKWNRNVDQETLIECYETYLRMAQMHQRSQFSFVMEMGRKVGQPIIDMTFDEYLKDSLKVLDWRIKKELPALYKLQEDGGIGIGKAEMELSIQMCEAAHEAITKYFTLSEDKQLIYI